MDNIIEIRELCKNFGDVRAVDRVSFSVQKGELFAFLGINGAGKSTTISIICDTLKKDSGEVLIDGIDASVNSEKIKNKLGVVFQHSVLDRALSVKDNLTYRAAMYGISGKAFEERLAELSEMLDLGDILNRTVGKLSGGQRRRIDIARALIHDPEILILDEPTTGLDPQTRKKLWQVISSLREKKGMTVFLTTHYMEEAADADHVVILDAGHVVAEGTPLELKNRFTGDYLLLYGITEEQARMLGKPYEVFREYVKVTVSGTREATELIVRYPELFCDYEILKAKMDDVFLAATGKLLAGDEYASKEGARS